VGAEAEGEEEEGDEDEDEEEEEEEEDEVRDSLVAEHLRKEQMEESGRLTRHKAERSVAWSLLPHTILLAPPVPGFIHQS